MRSALTLNLFDIPSEQVEGDSYGEAYTGVQSLSSATQSGAPSDEGGLIQIPSAAEVSRVLEDRWYQTKALEEIAQRMPKGARRRGGKGELLVSPTGCGKTSIASRAIKRWLDEGERVLVLVDLDRLLDQMYEDLALEGIHPLIEKAEVSARGGFGIHGNCVLASMHSLYDDKRGNGVPRLRRWAPDSFDKIVIDEAHELKWLKIVDWFKCPYLGLTATPVRADRQSLKEYFHYPYIKTLNLRDAIEGWDGVIHEDGHKEYGKPFLCRIRLETIPAHHIDISRIKVLHKNFDHGSDLSAIEMNKVIYEHTNWLASAIVEHAQERPSFIYCPKVSTADAIAKAMRDIGAKAQSYTNETPNPKEVLDRFRDGDLQFLTNVNMLIKGVNVPKVSAIFRVRASLNIGQATQEIGRGTRNSPETGKEDCVIFEFDYNAGKRKLASVIDSILDGADDPDEMTTPEQQDFMEKVRERVEKIVKSKEDTDLVSARAKAEQQVNAEAIAARKRREEERQAKYQKVEVPKETIKYDPFAGLEKIGNSGRGAAPVKPATAEQIEKLKELSGGVITDASAKHISAEAADKRITQLEYDKKHKRASEKQRKLLVEVFGWEQKKVKYMKTWEASKIITATKAEMAHALEAHGFNFQQIMKGSLTELIRAHRAHCGGAEAA